LRLTAFTDYSLRVLTYLALTPNRKVNIRNVAESYDISRNHLMKVVNKLTRANLVEASRGVNGGLILARPADEITVGEVVRNCEDDLALTECFRDENLCVITPVCHLRNILQHARDEFMGILDQYTIADLVNPKLQPRLKKYLNIQSD